MPPAALRSQELGEVVGVHGAGLPVRANSDRQRHIVIEVDQQLHAAVVTVHAPDRQPAKRWLVHELSPSPCAEAHNPRSVDGVSSRPVRRIVLRAG
jgi:hypothetical protein